NEQNYIKEKNQIVISNDRFTSQKYNHSVIWISKKNTFIYSSFITEFSTQKIFNYLNNEKSSYYFLNLILKNSKVIKKINNGYYNNKSWIVDYNIILNNIDKIREFIIPIKKSELENLEKLNNNFEIYEYNDTEYVDIRYIKN
ncbi:9166_t:CDS:1, partial [Cetraspora pellucida]